MNIKKMSKEEFIEKCGALLNIANPSLEYCKLMRGSEIVTKNIDVSLKPRICTSDEYVYVHCENGYGYAIPIECNSFIEIAKSIFSNMSTK